MIKYWHICTALLIAWGVFIIYHIYTIDAYKSQLKEKDYIIEALQEIPR